QQVIAKQTQLPNPAVLGQGNRKSLQIDVVGLVKIEFVLDRRHIVDQHVPPHRDYIDQLTLTAVGLAVDGDDADLLHVEELRQVRRLLDPLGDELPAQQLHPEPVNRT